jgi:hypothetical protein
MHDTLGGNVYILLCVFFLSLNPCAHSIEDRNIKEYLVFLHHASAFPDCIYIHEHSAVFLNGEVRLYEYRIYVGGFRESGC